MWCFKYRLRLNCLLLVWLSQTTFADQIIGPTYPIEEESLDQVIATRLKQLESNGELAVLEDTARQRVKQYIQSPDPVAFLKTTTSPATRYYDPTIIVPYDIRDAEGKLLYAAGTRVNPLSLISLSRPLVFFNGDDQQQVHWVEALSKHYHRHIKPILVAGSPLALMQQWQMPVAFDQQGLLVEKLGIKQVPAIVSQDGQRLRIEEVLP